MATREQGQAAVDFIKSRCSPVIAENDRLRAEVERLEEALESITKKGGCRFAWHGRGGRFDRDPFVHACNTIKDMAEIAKKALEGE